MFTLLLFYQSLPYDDSIFGINICCSLRFSFGRCSFTFEWSCKSHSPIHRYRQISPEKRVLIFCFALSCVRFSLIKCIHFITRAHRILINVSAAYDMRDHHIVFNYSALFRSIISTIFNYRFPSICA